jgi:Holliday junction DNA helicase RuvA
VIGHLQGKLLDSTPERLLLDVHGVGYLIHIPLSTYAEIERSAEGGSIGLYIHTHVRDDAIELFGFHTSREKRLFERLIAVGGIGPRLARVILSGMAPADLVAALAAADVARLSTIPGVGKKTAERMVVELKDRIRELADELPEATAATAGDDLVLALIGLGYKAADAERAVAAARQGDPDAELEKLLPAALKLLSRA